MNKNKVTLYWMRRDLRLFDNAALYAAQKSGFPVVPVFIFDKDILDHLPAKDARVLFIHQEIAAIKNALRAMGSDLLVYYGTPEEAFEHILQLFDVAAVHTARDYEPYAQERDARLHQIFNAKGIPFKGKKDHVIFDKNEIVKDDGKPYTVFTPYSRKWKSKLTPFHYTSYPNERYYDRFHKGNFSALPSLEDMGFTSFEFDFPKKEVSQNLIANYEHTRDIPSLLGTSRLSLHLRFGTVSIRQLVARALTHEKWLNELIWRDFYQAIVYHFPHSAQAAFKPNYDRIPWRNNEADFKRWCDGHTGYPIVDAGMRELNATGFMHNRVRMIVASFLTKHLLIDWRWGERYFAEKLLDFDLASNVGGWQWAASSGCDAAPYFRVFNPESQTQKFDKDHRYIQQWVPEFGTSAYPAPMVEHKFARERVLATYKEALRE
jgi:deoxyribodipyrimidine photo-lyase